MKSTKVNKRFKKLKITNRTVYGFVDFMNVQKQRLQGQSTSSVSSGTGPTFLSPAHISHTDKFIMPVALKIGS